MGGLLRSRLLKDDSSSALSVAYINHRLFVSRELYINYVTFLSIYFSIRDVNCKNVRATNVVNDELNNNYLPPRTLLLIIKKRNARYVGHHITIRRVVENDYVVTPPSVSRKSKKPVRGHILL